MNRLLSLALPALIAAGPPAQAQIEGLAALKSSRERLDRVCASMQQIRGRFLERRDSLSFLIDSLRSRAPGSAGLRRLQLESRQLLHRLLDVESRLDSAAAVVDSLEEELRAAYDWEISRLIGLLEEGGWDRGLYTQLEVFQEERRALGDIVDPGHYRLDDEHELALNDQDGPEVIRQKLELARYKAARAREGWHDISDRLARIEAQLRMLRRLGRLDGGDGLLLRRLDPQKQQVGEAQRPPPASPTPEEASLLLEARRLKARQQELREVGAFLQGRIDAFGERLEQIGAAGPAAPASP